MFAYFLFFLLRRVIVSSIKSSTLRRTIRRSASAIFSLLLLLSLIGYSSPASAAGSIAWTQESPSTNPGASAYSTMAYDVSSGQLILFGGQNSNGTVSNSTWEWSGTNWVLLSPTTVPTARYAASMAYDSSNGTLVMFGGYSGSAYLNDTWTWNGTNWTQQSPSTSPTARWYASMAYDSSSNQVVLFGGQSSSGTILNDTWTWNGTNWTQQSPSTSPTARYESAMAYDSSSNQVVLFGGNSGSGILGDTWTWNGTNWTQQSPATVPPARDLDMMAYDNAINQAVLFGGNGTTAYLNDTWTWNGTNWAQLSPTTPPTARYSGSLYYYPGSSALLLFGGYGSSGFMSDTWEFTDSISYSIDVLTPSQPIVAGVPFEATIEAVSGGQIDTSINDSVTLTSADGSVNTTFTLSGGSWTGNITITSAYSADTLSANDTTAGLYGTSGAFNVEAGPLAQVIVTPSTLNIRPNGTQSFTAQGEDAYGNPIGGLSYSWGASSGSPTNGSGSSFSWTAPATPGQQTITATSGGISGSSTIDVGNYAIANNSWPGWQNGGGLDGKSSSLGLNMNGASLLWSAPLSGQIGSQPVYDNGNYVVEASGGSSDVYIYSSSGSLLYTWAFPSGFSPSTTLYTQGNGSNAVDVAPTIMSDGTILISGYNSSLNEDEIFAISPNGSLIWQTIISTGQANNPVGASNVNIAGGMVVVNAPSPNAPCFVYGLSPATGSISWTYQATTGACEGNLSVSGNTVYIPLMSMTSSGTVGSGGIDAVDATNGTLLWSSAIPGSTDTSPSQINMVSLIPLSNGDILALDYYNVAYDSGGQYANLDLFSSTGTWVATRSGSYNGIPTQISPDTVVIDNSGGTSEFSITSGIQKNWTNSRWSNTYASDNAGHFYYLDQSSGDLVEMSATGQETLDKNMSQTNPSSGISILGPGVIGFVAQSGGGSEIYVYGNYVDGSGNSNSAPPGTWYAGRRGDTGNSSISLDQGAMWNGSSPSFSKLWSYNTNTSSNSTLNLPSVTANQNVAIIKQVATGEQMDLVAPSGAIASSVALPNGTYQSAPTSGYNNIYVTSTNNGGNAEIQAFSSNEKSLWTYIGGAIPSGTTPTRAVFADGGVVFGAGSNVYAISKSGTLIWEYAVGGLGSSGYISSIASDQYGNVFITSQGGGSGMPGVIEIQDNGGSISTVSYTTSNSVNSSSNVSYMPANPADGNRAYIAIEYSSGHKSYFEDWQVGGPTTSSSYRLANAFTDGIAVNLLGGTYIISNKNAIVSIKPSNLSTSSYTVSPGGTTLNPVAVTQVAPYGSCFNDYAIATDNSTDMYLVRLPGAGCGGFQKTASYSESGAVFTQPMFMRPGVIGIENIGNTPATLEAFSLDVPASISINVISPNANGMIYSGQPVTIEAVALTSTGSVDTLYQGNGSVSDYSSANDMGVANGYFTNGIMDIQTVFPISAIGDVVTASSEGLSASSTVTVIPYKITITTPSSPQIAGNPFNITTDATTYTNKIDTGYNSSVSLTSLDGSIFPTTGTYSSGVATISSTITIADASDQVTASTVADGQTLSATTGTFSVIPNHLSVIALTPSSSTVTVNGTQSFSAQGEDAYGNAISGLTYAWSASGGTLSATSGTSVTYTAGTVVGTYAITASSTETFGGTPYNANGNATIIINPGPLNSVVISPTSATLAPTATQSFSAQGEDAYGNAISGLTYAWSASGGTLSATSGTSVTYTAGTVVGSYSNTVSTSQGSTNVNATASITIAPGSLYSVAITPSTATLTPTQTQAFSAQGEDKWGNAIGGLTYTWGTSGNGGSLSATSGQTITYTAGTTPGSYLQSVSTSQGSTNVNATATITINPGPLYSVSTNPTLPITMSTSASQTITAQGYDYWGNPISGLSYSWTATKSSGSSGLSPLSATGSSVTFSTNSGAKGSYTIVVSAQETTPSANASTSGTIYIQSAAITITPNGGTLDIPGTQQFTAYSGSGSGETVATGTWSISGTTGATITPTTNPVGAMLSADPSTTPGTINVTITVSGNATSQSFTIAYGVREIKIVSTSAGVNGIQTATVAEIKIVGGTETVMYWRSQE